MVDGVMADCGLQCRIASSCAMPTFPLLGRPKVGWPTHGALWKLGLGAETVIWRGVAHAVRARILQRETATA